MKTRRLFFALWPPDSVRQSIIKASKPSMHKLKGRIIKPDRLHITLHFIGPVNDDVRQCMHEAALTVSGKSFDLKLDYLGQFFRARILWLGARVIPVELSELHKDLGQALSACGYQCDRRPFSPHITLMRKCIKPVKHQPEISIPWRIEKFVLVESVQDETGVSYQVLEKYSLK
ncbi:MAG: RNA 2',3'-cyclic phosphodiesterase [Gammaproteobacteria bacterium]|nr:RNA 2',3'-cyclic phosphodiesterase [Gammaproteobacteria bacterium]MBT8133784.1 RNA 2',3'-cyclic phosphodiesterase [Gammaproteobacteria bacterium]NNJ49162.1 RNA 2',3'-cyclic phosphodiesterase [Gammaproteobacteria bacterium]